MIAGHFHHTPAHASSKTLSAPMGEDTNLLVNIKLSNLSKYYTRKLSCMSHKTPQMQHHPRAHSISSSPQCVELFCMHSHM